MPDTKILDLIPANLRETLISEVKTLLEQREREKQEKEYIAERDGVIKNLVDKIMPK